MDRRQRQFIPVAHRAADHDEAWHREGHRPWPASGRQQYDGHTVHANLPLTLGDAAAAFNNQVIRGALAPTWPTSTPKLSPMSGSAPAAP